jgi:hypothetical protein
MSAQTALSPPPEVAHARTPTIVDAATLAALVVVGFVLRLPGVRVWYWGDEIQTVVISKRSLTEIPSGLARDGAPPLFYYLLHFWMRVFGSSETSTHSLTVLLGLLTIVAAWWFGRRHGGLWGALLAGAAIAVNPFLVQYSTETRNYALFALLGVVAIGLTLDLLLLETRYTHYVLGVVLGLTMLTHAWGLFFVPAVVGAIWLDAFVRRDRELAVRGGISLAIAIVLFAPWVPKFIDQTRHTGAPWNVRYSLPSTLDQMVPYVGNRAVAAIAVLAVAVAFVAAYLAKRLAIELVVAAVACVATLAAAFVYSYVTPVWQARYGLVVVGAALLVAGVVASRTRAGVGALSIALVAMAAWTVHEVSDIKKDGKPDARLRDVAAVVADDVPQIAVSDQGTLNTLRYYLGDEQGGPVRYISPYGQLPDPTFYDWRDDLDRLRAADPPAVAATPIADAAPGTTFLVVEKLASAPRPFGPSSGSNEYEQRFVQTATELETATLGDSRLAVVRTVDVDDWRITFLRRV